MALLQRTLIGWFTFTLISTFQGWRNGPRNEDASFQNVKAAFLRSLTWSLTKTSFPADPWPLRLVSCRLVSQWFISFLLSFCRRRLGSNSSSLDLSKSHFTKPTRGRNIFTECKEGGLISNYCWCCVGKWMCFSLLKTQSQRSVINSLSEANLFSDVLSPSSGDERYLQAL